jgi:hypothetical protein
MTRIQTVLMAAAAISLAIAAGTGIYETHRLSRMQEEIVALQQKQAPLTKQLQQLREERDEATRRLAAIQQEEQQQAKSAEPASSPTNSPPPALGTPAAAEASTNSFAGLATMLKDPQMKEMIRAQQKMMVGQMYGSLYKELGLSPTDEEALKKLLEDRQMALMDAGLAAMGGSAADSKQAAEDAKALKTQYEKQIEDLLGPQAYSVFQQYDQTVAERTQVNLFKQSLSADNALTEQQENNLVAAMYQARKTLPENSLLNGQSRDPSQLTEDGIAQALKLQEQLQKQYADSAASILTPAQLDQFTKFQQQMSAMQAAGMKMAAQMFGQNKPNTSPAPNPGSRP